MEDAAEVHDSDRGADGCSANPQESGPGISFAPRCARAENRAFGQTSGVGVGHLAGQLPAFGDDGLEVLALLGGDTIKEPEDRPDAGDDKDKNEDGRAGEDRNQVSGA